MAAPKFPDFPLLIVDDESEVLDLCEFVLRSSGITNVLTCQDSREVKDLVVKNEIGIALLDLTMPHISGAELLQWMTEKHPHIPVIIVTAVNEVDTAVKCMKSGAFDYLLKPLEKNAMESAVRKAIEFRDLRHEYSSFKRRVLADKLENPASFSKIVTGNSLMRSIFQYVETIAPTARPVLITGETGVGKDLLAKALHDLSGRTGEYVVVNVAGLDDNVFSDTLFGHAKGAYTGADQPRAGLISQAAGGTLFLDEIGDLNGASQIKLLRLLQDGDYLSLGSDIPKRSDARIIASTNRDLKARIQEDKFRADLFYRLQSHQIHLPPLRERFDDLPVLVDHFLEKGAKDLGKKKPTPPKELCALLATYHFPGNIRELDTMVFDALSRHESKILSMDRFRGHIESSRSGPSGAKLNTKEGESPFSLFEDLPTLKDAQRLLMIEAMRRADGNQSIAARLLGITQSGFSKALRREGLV